MEGKKEYFLTFEEFSESTNENVPTTLDLQKELGQRLKKAKAQDIVDQFMTAIDNIGWSKTDTKKFLSSIKSKLKKVMESERPGEDDEEEGQLEENLTKDLEAAMQEYTPATTATMLKLAIQDHGISGKKARELHDGLVKKLEDRIG